MGLLDFLKPKIDKTKLTQEEEPLAVELINTQKLQTHWDASLYENAVKTLASKIYHAAGLRSQKKFPELREMANEIAILQNRKLLNYYAIYSTILDSLYGFYKNEIVYLKGIESSEAKATILVLVNKMSEEFKKI